MQIELLNNIPINDLREVNVAEPEVLETLLNVLDANEEEIPGGNFYNFLRIAEQNQYQLAHDGDTFTSRTLLALSNVYLYLIEESSWLVRLPKNEADKERARVEDVCRRLRACADAAELLRDKEADTYINRFLTKVQKTGYIHRKEKTCQVVLDLMRMDNSYFNYIPVLVDIVLMRQQEEWIASDFRGQLVALLQEFITHQVEVLKNLVSPDGKEEQEQVAQVIKAIAMQLLLFQKTDEIDFAYNRALLYRFSSYIPTANSISLLNNAYKCLIGQTSDMMLEYTWGSLSSVGVIASLLSVPKEMNHAIHKAYSNEKQIIDLTDKAIILRPSGLNEAKPIKAIPSVISMWHGLQIEVDNAPDTKVNRTTTDLKLFNLWWKEIEQDLFRERKLKTPIAATKKRPSVGDNVWIVIDGIIDSSEFAFHATIRDDESFVGDGIIYVKDDIVGYDPRSINASYFLDNGFRDTKQDLPYIFEATVIGSVGSMLHFSMAKLIEEDWKESDITNYGNEINAVVTYKLDSTGQCIAVSEFGQTVQFVDKMDFVRQGDKVILRVVGVKDTKKHGLQLLGEYISMSEVDVTQQHAIVNLLQAYSRGEVYDENNIIEQTKEESPKTPELEIKIVSEMVRLIDRQAYLSKDLIDRFILLHVAGTLSRIIDNQYQVEYYRHCCEQQITLQEFGKNNAINLDKLQKLDEIPAEMLSMFPVLQLRRQELHALNALGKPDDKDKILLMLETTDNAELKRLCNLVLAYNFLSEFKMESEKKAIVDEISNLMNIKLDIQEALFMGAENEITEFKMSLVYIANALHKVIPDPQAQMQIILKEINAFLNTKGGKLYVGVNNLGYAVGVSDDLEWFQRNQGNIANVSDMDTYQQYLTNCIYKAWPDINTLIQISKPDCNGRDVVLVEVLPSSIPLTLDGNYYYRVGTETRMVTKEGEKEFLKRRPAQYESLKQ